MLAAGVEGHLREERLGLPDARHSQFQPIPVDTLQGTAEPLKLMAPQWKHVQERAENARQAEADRTERVRSSRGDTTVREGEGRAPCARAGIPLSPPVA